jgi:hypothetical protein
VSLKLLFYADRKQPFHDRLRHERANRDPAPLDEPCALRKLLERILDRESEGGATICVVSLVTIICKGLQSTIIWVVSRVPDSLDCATLC